MSETREINLIPSDVATRSRARKRIWTWAIVMQLVLALCIVSYTLESRVIGAVEGEIASLSLQQQEMDEKIRQLAILRENRDRLQTKKKIVNSLMHKVSLSSLFTELERAMNNNVWLTSFDIEDTTLTGNSSGKGKDEWVETGYFIVKKDGTGAHEDEHMRASGIVTVLQGNARSNKDIAFFLEHLSRSDYFFNVELKYSREESEDDGHGVSFEIEAYLRNAGQG